MAAETKEVFEFGLFRLDPAERQLTRENIPVHLPPKAFDLLMLFVENPGRLLKKEELLKQLWPDTFVEESNLAQHASMLRKALREGPEEGCSIETVPRRGYRFNAKVRRSCNSGSDAPLLKSKEPRNWVWLAGAAILGLIALGFLGWQWGHSGNGSRSKILLVVLPFQNLTGDPGQDFFSDGFTEELITELGQMRPERLGVIARTSAMHYRNTPADIAQIGRELGVQYVLEGSVRRSGQRIRISAQLIQVKDQTHLWAENYERGVRDVLGVQREVGRAIAQQIEIELSPEDRSRLARTRSVNPEAYDLYLQGRYFWNKRDRAGFEKAIQYINQAIAKDASAAQFYAGLADAYALLGSLPDPPIPRREAMEKARAAALTAIAMDDDLADAHTSLAFVLMHYDWNWAAAEKEFQRALELNGNYATAHHWYAFYLIARGEKEESIREIRRAEELDPLSLIISRDVGDLLYYARRYDESIAQCLRTLERDPNFVLARMTLVENYAEKHMYREVDEELNRLRSTPYVTGFGEPITVSQLAPTADRRSIRQEIGILKGFERKGMVLSYEIACAYATLGESDQAFEWLEVAYRNHVGSLILMKTDPKLDGVRDDPRFADLLKRMGLS